MQTGVEDALHIAQYLLDQSEMSSHGLCMKRQNLLNDAGEVRPSLCQVCRAPARLRYSKGYGDRTTISHSLDRESTKVAMG